MRRSSKRAGAVERFWRHVDRSGGPDACWPWTSERTKDGYGLFRVADSHSGPRVMAHRFAWETEHGPIPTGLVRDGWRPSERIDLLLADPPCTPWSRAGKRRGTADERDMLVATVELVALLRPRAYLIANVPEALSHLPPDELGRPVGLRCGAQGATVVAPWPWDRPSTTITGDPRIPPPGRHEQSFMSDPNAIVLSERAAAILQGFPEGWVFSGATKRSRWGQIGMAMPPPLAEAVARRIKDWFEATSKERAAS